MAQEEVEGEIVGGGLHKGIGSSAPSIYSGTRTFLFPLIDEDAEQHMTCPQMATCCRYVLKTNEMGVKDR